MENRFDKLFSFWISKKMLERIKKNLISDIDESISSFIRGAILRECERRER